MSIIFFYWSHVNWYKYSQNIQKIYMCYSGTQLETVSKLKWKRIKGICYFWLGCFCSYCLSCCVMKPVMSHVCLSMHSVIKLCSTLTSFHQSYSLEATCLQQTCWSNIWMFIPCHPQNKRLVLPVLWCSSHMARAALGNLTLLSTLINDDPTPQTPCRHLTIAAVRYK